jgi:heme A synthase
MADVVPIPGAESTAKVRSPIWVTVLALVTLGIYAIFWWYFVHRELRDYGQARGTDELGTSPGKSVLAITLGALIIVPAIIGYINGFKRVQAAQRLNAINPINGWIGLLIFIVFYPAFYGYMQSGLNAVWQRATAPGQAAPEPTA